MKNIKLFTQALIVALTTMTSLSLQAAELIKVEPLNRADLTINIKTELAQSFKKMNLVTFNVEKSAQDILVTQNNKNINLSDMEPKIDALAE